MNTLVRLILLVLALLCPLPALAQSVLPEWLGKVPAAELVEGADGYGPIREDLPVAPVLKGGETIVTKAGAFVRSGDRIQPVAAAAETN